MPEGDTIFRAARTLNLALAGRLVTRFETQLPLLARVDYDTPLTGRTVERVESAGKWIRAYFTGDLILVTHMLMSGSWHIYRPAEVWRRPRVQMRVAVHTQDFVAVAFNVPIAEFHTTATLRRHRSVQSLGPDVLGANFDAAAAITRLESRPDLQIGEALLQQSLVAGLGNVFKSEVCYISGVNPFRKVATLSGDEFQKLIGNAERFLKMNVTSLSTDRIVTYTGARQGSAERALWVYQRRGQPCRKCGTGILSRKQGVDARVTFWCPECQP